MPNPDDQPFEVYFRVNFTKQLHSKIQENTNTVTLAQLKNCIQCINTRFLHPAICPPYSSYLLLSQRSHSYALFSILLTNVFLYWWKYPGLFVYRSDHPWQLHAVNINICLFNKSLKKERKIHFSMWQMLCIWSFSFSVPPNIYLCHKIQSN